jgi:hypothetical protein
MCAELTVLLEGHVVVALSGEIDMLAASAVREALAEATRPAVVTGVIIDPADCRAGPCPGAAGLGLRGRRGSGGNPAGSGRDDHG